MCPTKLFQFLRGALRGAYGTEDLRSRKFLIVGPSKLGQEILGRLCLPDVDISVKDCSMVDYPKLFSVCGYVDTHGGEERDVIIDTIVQQIVLKGKSVPFSSIGDDAYTQGIHEFYL